MKTNYNGRIGQKSLKEMYNKLNTGIVIHAPDTSILDFNSKSLELLGLEEKQMLGKKAIKSEWKFLDKSGNILDEKLYPVNQIISNRAELKGMVIGIDTGKNSNINWVLVNGFPEYDEDGSLIEVLINFNDITEQILLEHNLELSKRKVEQSANTYKNLLNNIVD